MVTRGGCSNAADGLPSDAAASLLVGDLGVYLAGVPLVLPNLLNRNCTLSRITPMTTNQSLSQTDRLQPPCEAGSVFAYVNWYYFFTPAMGSSGRAA